MTSSPAHHTPQTARRILYIDHCALMSGGEIALLNLVSTLDRARFEPIVLLCSVGPLVAELNKAGVETHVVPLDRSIAETRKDALGTSSLGKLGAAWGSAKYVRTLARFIREHRIDLVHTNSLKADLLGGFAARWARRPLIWHVRDRISDDYLPKNVATAFRWLCGIVPTAVAANSHATMRTIRHEGERSDLGYIVVHDGMPMTPGGSQVCGDSSVESEIALQDDMSRRAPLIALLGRISPWKGQHIFIRAAAIVLRQFPAARFRIIGKVMFDEAEYEKQVHALVDELGVRGSVEFVGFRSDVAAALSELDLLVHASTTGEPFGQVIVEGMAAGLPVVATDGGGVPEIVVHGETGLLVPMNDVEAMAAAILRILSDPAAAREMGRKGQRRAREVFSIERTARAVEAIYDRLLAGRR